MSMMLRKILVGMLVIVMVSPAWSGGKPLGSVTSSSDATVGNAKLTPGSTVFLGDVISVAEHGGVHVALSSGEQAEVLANSSVRLTMVDDKIQMVVDRGQASFHTSGHTSGRASSQTSGGNTMSALVGDATVRPANSAETSAVIQSLSETHAIIAAEKGTLLVTTAYDGKVYTVPEGKAADLSAGPDPQQNGGAVPAGRAAPKISSNKKVVYWTVAIVGAGVIIAAVVLARREANLSSTTLGNEISPHTLN
jgi:hypothetical protein